jgi:uncharacterized protein (DUF1800 family)
VSGLFASHLPARRWRGAILGLLVAAGALVSPAFLQAQPLGEMRASQLLARAGFAPSLGEVASFADLTQAQAVDRLLGAINRQARTPAPSWIDAPIVLPRDVQRMPEAEQRAYRQTLVRHSLELRGWWLREMADTSSPLSERMTLFWHNHFVSAQPKVRWPQMLYRQNVLLREHAVGDFAALLHAVVRDPAMLVYLDAATSRRGQPNENLARELMELFTLGQGHYTETDVREAARAFTGYSVDPATGQFVLRRGLHDPTSKSILGRQGRFDGAAVVDLLLAQPASAEFVVSKLWREFVSPQPDPVRVAQIAKRFRDSGHAIAVALQALLNQPEVVALDVDQALVKSPVELVIGLVRQSGGELALPAGAALATASMGQNLFGAPNVRGWPGGEAWINTQSLLARKQFIERAISQRGATPRPVGPNDNEMLSPATPAQDEMAEALRRRARLAQVAVANAVRVDYRAWLAASADLQPERPTLPGDSARLAAHLGWLPPVTLPPAGSLALDALRSLLLDPTYQLK